MKKRMKSENSAGLTVSCEAAIQQNNSFLRLDLIALFCLGALLLVSFGGLLLSLFEISAYGIVLILWGAVCVGGCITFYAFPGIRRWLLIGAVALIGALIVFTWGMFSDGFGLVVNAVKDFFGSNFSSHGSFRSLWEKDCGYGLFIAADPCSCHCQQLSCLLPQQYFIVAYSSSYCCRVGLWLVLSILVLVRPCICRLAFGGDFSIKRGSARQRQRFADVAAHFTSPCGGRHRIGIACFGILWRQL